MGSYVWAVVEIDLLKAIPFQVGVLCDSLVVKVIQFI